MSPASTRSQSTTPSANEMMLKNELNHAMIVEAVGKANTAPRPGAMSLLTECISEGIPVMIVSAGRTPQTRCAYKDWSGPSTRNV